MITTEFKHKILFEIGERRVNYASDAKMATFIGISTSQYSRIMKGEIDRVVSDATWISIARKLDVQMNDNFTLQIAKTYTYEFITAQLDICQSNSISLVLCDKADIGKTFTAKEYTKRNKNCVYVDCSQVKSKQKLIRFIAKEFGLNSSAKYAEVYEDLVYYIRSIQNPLIILDEAGDLNYDAFLETKALWNATEGSCGYYMMGADGLRAKIKGNINKQKVGYTEIFSRYGQTFQKATPDGKEDMDQFIKSQVAAIAKANGMTDIQRLYARTNGSLRRLQNEIKKSRMEEVA